MKRCFLNKIGLTAALTAAVIIGAVPLGVHAQPVYEIEGVEELQQVTEENSVIVENGGAEEYIASGNQGGEAYETPSIIENENGKFYLLEKSRTAYEAVSREYILYCGLDMVRSNYPPDVPLPKGVEVYLEIPTGVTARLYRDGIEVEPQQKYTISEPGRYVLNLVNISGKTETYDYILLSEKVNFLNSITLPEGFEINYIEYNGNKLTLQYSNYADIIIDGSYRIGWMCKGPQLYYHTDFILDTEPPVLSLPQVVNGEAEEPVTLTDLEPGAVIKCKIDGIDHYIDNPQTVLDEPGSYELTVYDTAGNTSVYKFRLNMYVDIYGYIALIMIIALAVSLVFYSKWLKKHMRVG